MPLVAHNALPAFSRLQAEGQFILDRERAESQDIREQHIGLLNMMPDKALAATERQFLRLVGESNPIAQFYVHPFTLPQLPRSAEAQAHIDRYYESFDQLREEGLDALIITGANVNHEGLEQEPFWEPLIEVIDWAAEQVTSTLCSCLATHAVMQFRYSKRRIKQPRKIWGVFEHRVVAAHPLVSDINTRFDVPHSRWNDVSRDQFESAGLRVLVESSEAGVHLATSGDGLRFIFFQGHPEYDTISLLKEYKREVGLYANGARDTYPPFPDSYFAIREQALLNEYQGRIEYARESAAVPPDFPEALAAERLDNTWHDTAEKVVSNWIGCVYQTTHHDRQRPFRAGVDPDDPLRIGATTSATG